MNGLQAKVKQFMGTKFGHYNASYNALEEKYGPAKKDTVCTMRYNNFYKDEIISTFYDGNKKIAETCVSREFTSGDKYIPCWEDEFFDNAYVNESKEYLHDYTTGLTYGYCGNNKAALIQFDVGDNYVVIQDTNRNGIVDKEDIILGSSCKSDITVGEFLDMNFEENENAADEKVEEPVVTTEEKQNIWSQLADLVSQIFK